MKSRRALSFCSLSVFALAAACSGSVDSADPGDDGANPSAEQPSLSTEQPNPTPSTPSESPERDEGTEDPSAPEPPACSAGALEVAPTWTMFAQLYGTERQSLFAFSPDSRSVALSGNLYDPRTVLVSAGDGALLSSTGTAPQASSRDGEWRRELRLGRYAGAHAVEVVELESGRGLWSTNDVVLGAALSRDGERVATLACDALRVTAIDDGSVTVLPRDGECAEGAQARVEFTPDGETILVALSGHGSVLAYDLETRTARAVEVAGAATDTRLAYHGPILDLRVSPDGRFAGVTSTDGWFQLLELPALAPVAEWSVGWSAAYEYCYCDTLFASPIAFSASGELIATLSEDRDIVVRNTCDQSVAAVIPNPLVTLELSNPDHHGPLQLAFSADGALLGARTERGVAAYRLLRTE